MNFLFSPRLSFTRHGVFAVASTLGLMACAVAPEGSVSAEGETIAQASSPLTNCPPGEPDCVAIVSCYHDNDGDGFGAGAVTHHIDNCPAGLVSSSNDCDDSVATIHPRSCGGPVGTVCGSACPTTTYPEVDWLDQFAAQYTFNGLVGEHALHAEHENWHLTHSQSSPNYGTDFLSFHRMFIKKYDDWRAAHGVVPIPIWNPATPIPAEVPHAGRSTSNPQIPRPAYLTWQGGGATVAVNGDTIHDLAQFPSADSLGRAIDSGWHQSVHCAIGGDMCDIHDAPKDPVFWRWHKFIDSIWQEWEHCPTPPQANQIILWSESNNWGRCSIASLGTFDNGRFMSDWDNVSSLTLGSSARVHMTAGNNFTGASLVTDATMAFVGASFNDAASSFWIRYRTSCPPPSPDQVVVYSESDFWGSCSVLDTGTYANPEAIGFTSGISSFRVGSKVRGVFYENTGFSGAAFGANTDLSFIGTAWNDRTESIKVVAR